MIEISLKPETLFTFAGIPITNSMWVSFFNALLLIVVLGISARRMKLIPGKFQLIIELLIGGLYDFLEGVTQNKKITQRLFPLFATLVLFYLISNLSGFIPGLAAISINGIPAYRLPTADYAMIFVITVTMFILWQFVGIVTGGFVHYIKKFLNFSSPVNFLIGLLDIVGELARIISLSFRLFGNIFAGEVIAIVLFALMPFVLPVPFLLLGIIPTVIQAFIFPILVVIFITMAIETKEGKDGHAKHAVQSTT